MRPGANVRRGPRNGACATKSAEQSRTDIGVTLRRKLAVGAVMTPGHPIGHHGRQQGFDAARRAMATADGTSAASSERET